MSTLPVSKALKQYAPDNCDVLALSSGDDYELLVTVSASAWAELSEQQGVKGFTRIGEVKEGGADVRLLKGGSPYWIEKEGYKHFD